MSIRIGNKSVRIIGNKDFKGWNDTAKQFGKDIGASGIAIKRGDDELAIGTFD